MRVAFLAPYPVGWAPSQRYRFEQYFPYLQAAGIQASVFPLLTPRVYQVLYRPGYRATKTAGLLGGLVRRGRQLAQAWRHDVIVVHREAFPFGGPFLEKMLLLSGRPMVFDFDDAIYLPNASQANSVAARLKRPRKTDAIVRLASRVTAGNHHLAAYARRFNPRVTVIPSTVETERYPLRCHRDSPRPRIGWSGSATTLPHFMLLAPALRRLARQRAFSVRVVGSADVTMPGVCLSAAAWSAASEPVELASFDVGVMPLPDEEWAKGKCGLKALLYMAAGVPAVCSPVGVNPEIITNGESGFLAGSDEEWVETLERLLGDVALRRRVGRAGRRVVEEHYSPQAHAPRFIAILRDLAPGAR